VPTKTIGAEATWSRSEGGAAQEAWAPAAPAATAPSARMATNRALVISISNVASPGKATNRL
jgi:hypothetical protein